MPSATAMEAIRPPSDLPPARTARPSDPDRPASNASSHVRTRTRSGSGDRRRRSTYGKLNRSVAIPWPPIPRANPAMNGCSIPAPAPWASTTVPAASGGSIQSAPTIPEPVSISPRSSGVAMSAMILTHGRHALPRDVGVRLRPVEARRLLPGGAEERRHAVLLREPVPFGGDQLHVPPLPHREDPHG